MRRVELKTDCFSIGSRFFRKRDSGKPECPVSRFILPCRIFSASALEPDGQTKNTDTTSTGAAEAGAGWKPVSVIFP